MGSGVFDAVWSTATNEGFLDYRKDKVKYPIVINLTIGYSILAHMTQKSVDLLLSKCAHTIVGPPSGGAIN
jgi:hypothetical protein